MNEGYNWGKDAYAIFCKWADRAMAEALIKGYAEQGWPSKELQDQVQAWERDRALRAASHLN